MALKFPKNRYVSKELLDLIEKFNNVPAEDHLQRLFYLQKINYLLKDIALNSTLFAWLSDTEADGWQAHLNAYSINADASIFVKGMQFAGAIVQHTKDKPVFDTPVEDIYPLLQERDELIRDPSFEKSKERYIAVNCQLQTFVDSDHRVKEIITRHSEILAMAKRKLDAVQNREPGTYIPGLSYKMEELGNHVNNYNFTFQIEGLDEIFVLRVEDRDKLGLEQDLPSFPVAKYFIEDYAVFMMEFKGEVKPIEYKPVVLSQFATGGNLAQVARSLRGTRDKYLGSIASNYFMGLIDFCEKLIDAKAFHPDIKLTNFLVHSNLIRVSDRKTFISEEYPLAGSIRTTPRYAPDEFTACLNENWTDYNSAVASNTVINMPQFMAYQLGMALKEFLILTQVDSVANIETFRNHDFNPAHYFKTTPNPIVNLSLLIQELTRSDPSKRLSIQQFKNLLKFRNLKPEQFYNKIEEELPSSTLGFQADIDAVNALLDGSFPETEFLNQANFIFNKISTSVPKETRLIRMAEKLAAKCYQEYAEPFFKQSIETALLEEDWKIAPWYRQLFHVLSFGYFRVGRVAELSDIQDTMGLDLNSERFLSFFPHLEFLPPENMDSLGETEAEYLKNAIKKNVPLIISDDSVEHSSESSTEDSISTTLPLNVTPISSEKKASLSGTTDSLSKPDPEHSDKSNVTPISTEKKAPLRCGTTEGGNKGGTSLSKADSQQSGNASDKQTSSTNASSNWGTMVFNDGNEKKEKNDKEEAPVAPSHPLTFFSRAKPNRVDSVRTSLFRDYGSYRKKPTPSHTHIHDINWEPLQDSVDLPHPSSPS